MNSSKKRIAIIDYGAGNIQNVIRAFSHIGVSGRLVSRREDLEEFSHAVIPGVGSYRYGAENLRRTGLDQGIKAFASQGFPILGICLGMQLLSEDGFEHGSSKGLGLLPGSVIPIVEHHSAMSEERVPHTGWTRIEESIPFHSSLIQGGDYYFSHSYMFDARADPSIVSATYRRGQSSIVSAVERGNVYGVQFHPEKSGELGLDLLNRFALLAKV
jgi:glutamine amidotransferase